MQWLHSGASTDLKKYSVINASDVNRIILEDCEELINLSPESQDRATPLKYLTVYISSVKSLSCVWLFATPWTTACQASLSITNSWSLFKLVSIESMMPSNHLISSSFPPAFNLCQHQGLYQWVSSLHEVVKVLQFQLQRQSFQWTPRTDLL